tara:strand:- start:383 stop:646 length:264 start_codon:yes stop_codon:yes gene_type:complete
MPDITISITDTEQKVLETMMVDIEEWIDNTVINRARTAKDEIISLLVAHCNANDVTIATGEDAQVTQAYDLNLVKKLTNDPPSTPEG